MLQDASFPNASWSESGQRDSPRLGVSHRPLTTLDCVSSALKEKRVPTYM